MTRKVPLTLVSGLFAAVLAAGCNGNKTAPVEVMISLDKTATALRSAKVTVDYHQSGGTPLMSDGVPACISIVPNVDCAFEDDGAGTLTITAKAQASFSAPVDLAVCRMVPDSADVDASQIASRLRVRLATAIAKDGKALDEKRLASASGTGRKSPGGGTSTAGDARKQGAAGTPASGSTASDTASDTKSGGADSPDVSGLMVNRDDLAAREARRKADAAGDSGSDAEAERAARERAAEQAREANRAEADAEAAEEADEDGNDPEDSQPVAAYDVVISVTSDSGPVSALQLDINHLGSSGGWQGAGSKANCQELVSANMRACNDKGRGRISCALIDVGGFPTPADVLSCVFKTGGTVSMSDFSAQVVDASDPQMNPIDVDVRVTSVSQR